LPASSPSALFASPSPCRSHGGLAGILTEADGLHALLDGHATRDTALAEVMHRQVSTIGRHAPASDLPEIVAKLDLIEYMTHRPRSEEHTSELQSREKLVCR